jgi:hypothetical protein
MLVETAIMINQSINQVGIVELRSCEEGYSHASKKILISIPLYTNIVY